MVTKYFKKHAATRNNQNAVLSDADIEAMLKKARLDIKEDVEHSIEDYIAHVNKDLVPMLLKALKASGKPEEAYEVWKKFSMTGNLVELRKALKNWNPPANKMFHMTNSMKRLEQKQEGDGRNLKRTAVRHLRAGFETAADRKASRKNKDTHSALNAQQDAIYDVFIYFWRMYQGPSAHIHPLREAIAPYMEKAVNEKLLSSYTELKAHAKKPLVDEKILRSRALREKVLQASLARFDKLADESYTKNPEPIIQDYGFNMKQMPDDAKFGIEIEGFSAIKEAFPKNLGILAQRLQEKGLAASAALKAKHTDYSDWTITYDNSIINPLEINGRWKTPHAITAQSSSFELVSPILKGVNGQKQLETAIDVLNDIKFKSNDTCGLHMHVSLEDPDKKGSLVSLDRLKNLVKALYNNREALDSLVHPERRGDGNNFALAIDGIDIDAVDDARDVETLVDIINPGYNRNSKFDMTGLVGGIPTIQYRCAGGANYLASTSDYAIILANFTHQALDNPAITIKNVVAGLEAQRDRMKLAQARTAKPAAHSMTR